MSSVTRARSYGSIYNSSWCHYCEDRATTQDHIVPRSAFTVPQSALPYWFRSHNVAPSCRPCNGFKAHFRSDCTCAQCTWCWGTALKLYLPQGYEVQVRRVIKVGQSRARLLAVGE